jgi:hypothetical protein
MEMYFVDLRETEDFLLFTISMGYPSSEEHQRAFSKGFFDSLLRINFVRI